MESRGRGVRGGKGGRGGRRGEGGGGGGGVEGDRTLQELYYFVGKCMTRPDLGFVGKLFDNNIDFLNGYRTHRRQRERGFRERESKRKTQVKMRSRKKAVSRQSLHQSYIDTGVRVCVPLTVYTVHDGDLYLLLSYFEESQALYSAVVTVGTIALLLKPAIYSRAGIHVRTLSV